MLKPMDFLRKHRTEIIVFTSITFLFFFSRLYRIASLPIFTDEAIYIRWAQVGSFDASTRFASLTDGKQPLFIWLTTLLMQVVHSPLAAGRLISVASGFFTLVGLFFLSRELFKNTWIGLLSSALFVFFPMSLVYNRMALYESLLGAFMVWSAYFEVLLVRRVRLDIALILAMIIGGGLLTKTSAFFSLYLLPASLILFNVRSKAKLKKFLKWVGLALVVIFLSLVYYSILRLSPLFYMIYEKNAVFIYHVSELLPYHAFTSWLGNLVILSKWLVTYATLPIILLIVFSFFVFQKYIREKLFLLSWFVIPFLFLGLFGRILHPRFFFFMTLFLLPLGALTLWKLISLPPKKTFIAFLILLIFLLPIKSDYYILTNLARAPIPTVDLDQYINSWPAGGGVKEIVFFLQKQSSQNVIYVVSEGTFGSLPTVVLDIYFGHNPNVQKQGIWPIPKDLPEDIAQKSTYMPVYVIFNQLQKPPSKWPLRLIGKYQKGMGNVSMSLYQITAKK